MPPPLLAFFSCPLQHLTEWGEDGLRTLCFAYREVPAEECEAWFASYSKALSNEVEKAKYDRGDDNNDVMRAMRAIERDLVLQVCRCRRVASCCVAGLPLAVVEESLTIAFGARVPLPTKTACKKVSQKRLLTWQTLASKSGC